jgi:hypothetical protein
MDSRGERSEFAMKRSGTRGNASTQARAERGSVARYGARGDVALRTA